MAKILKPDGKTEDLADISLDSLQKAVGGYIEHVVLTDGRSAYINEEGKMHGLPLNMPATLLYGSLPFDVIVGNMVILTEAERQAEE